MPLGLVDDFDRLWTSDESPPDVFQFLAQHPDVDLSQALAVVLRDQQRRWATATPLAVEDYLDRLPQLAFHSDARLRLVIGEIDSRRENGRDPDVEEYTSRYEDLSNEIKSRLGESAGTMDTSRSRIGLGATRTLQSAETAIGQRLGRYRLVRLLGEGAFGRVWLGQDDELQRFVAIKVPTRERFRKPEDAEAYLAEARTVATLDHPNIVPVYDVGRAEDGSVYVVSKFVEGGDLAKRIKQMRPSHEEAAQLLATLARALQHAHEKRLVHRDIKTANILIEAESNNPYLADFGLAMREDDFGKSTSISGTPAYMSPEQARGEGHRLDARSDIFSLGIVFYELLTGKLPFRGGTLSEIMHQISSVDPIPPRELDETVPAELERVCLRMLAKRVADRYANAAELAEDLAHWQQQPVAAPRDYKIVPRGLRSFGPDDADFFLDLLPGPRTRDGLPESLQFWKTRLEEIDPEKTFNVGLLYGPSGCGKSSLMKAGLLPRLSPQKLTVIYIEATPDETEGRISRLLRKQLPDLPADLGLAEAFAAIRRSQGAKVVLIIDQLEQWLHAHGSNPDAELIAALRQCDGGRLQAVLMVRDDFSMAAARFMRNLETRIVEGHNFATVDLFDVEHARKVFIKFGQAFGKLPMKQSQFTDAENQFITEVASGLARDGKVVSVRLALFAEMVKRKPWVKSTLDDVGGTQGIGVNFLEETFSGREANPEYRLHQQAAREVLQSLLPPVGTDIKGHMRSHAELSQASGYQDRPRDLEELLSILDGQLRLITPTDPEGGRSQSVSDMRAKYFQLTHDYLVPALREWLTRKQQETRKGRAELKLAERATLWNAKSENRYLPSLLEWSRIRFLTDRDKWTRPQRSMMTKAARVHGLRSILATSSLLAIGWLGLSISRAVTQQQHLAQAQTLVNSLGSADIAQVPEIVLELDRYRDVTIPLLREQFAASATGSLKLHAALALLSGDDGQLEYVLQQLPTCTLDQFPVLRDALLPYKETVGESLWDVAQDPQMVASKRFQAATALALYAPEDPRWEQNADFVVRHLTSAVPMLYLARRIEHLEMARNVFTGELEASLRDRQGTDLKQREVAAIALARYLKADPERLVNLILIADEAPEFSRLIDAVRPHADRIQARLLTELRAKIPSAPTDQQRDEHLKRQSLAAIALLHLGYVDPVWPLLDVSADLSLRSSAVHYLGKLSADPVVLAARLSAEQNQSIRRALVLGLGGQGASPMPLADQNRIGEQLKTLYVNDPDPGIHGAAAWTLRRWGLTLPKVPLGEPELTPQQRIRLKQAAEEIEQAQESLAQSELELPQRQLEWERLLRQQSLDGSSFLNEGLIVHYPLDETSGTEILNAANGGRAGQYQGPGQPQWLPGAMERGLQLRGTDDVVGEPLRSIAHDQPFSFGCWFVAEDASGGILLSNEDPMNGHRGIELGIYNSEFEVMISSGEADSQDYPVFRIKVKVGTPAGFPQAYWQHLFATYDGTGKAAGVQLYLNAVPLPVMVENDGLSGPIESQEAFRIGSRAPGELRFHGAIDDVRLYDQCLKQSQVQQLFQLGLQSLAGSPPAGRTPRQEDALASFYLVRDEQLRQLRSQLAESKISMRNARTFGIRRWFVNSEGQTMVIVSPRPEFSVSPIDHDFAISAHEVTMAEFLRFRADHQVDTRVAPTSDCPAHQMNWYVAAEYCNWLSEREGLSEDQWVYQPNDQGDYADGMKIKTDYGFLRGYRLPTQSEWEYACRAGTESDFGFGEPATLLENYGWYAVNSAGRTYPVASLFPNELGLFDMHGNVWEWCQTRVRDDVSEGTVYGRDRRYRLGGGYSNRSQHTISSHRHNDLPDYDSTTIGIRLVKAYP